MHDDEFHRNSSNRFLSRAPSRPTPNSYSGHLIGGLDASHQTEFNNANLSDGNRLNTIEFTTAVANINRLTYL